MKTKLIVRECENINQVYQIVRALESNGVGQEDIYVLAHENERTEQIADRTGANTIGLNEEGLGTAVKNLFESKGEKLRNKMEEMGLSEVEADLYEKKLDLGRILVFVKEQERMGSIF